MHQWDHASDEISHETKCWYVGRFRQEPACKQDAKRAFLGVLRDFEAFEINQIIHLMRCIMRQNAGILADLVQTPPNPRKKDAKSAILGVLRVFEAFETNQIMHLVKCNMRQNAGILADLVQNPLQTRCWKCVLGNFERFWSVRNQSNHVSDEIFHESKCWALGLSLSELPCKQGAKKSLFGVLKEFEAFKIMHLVSYLTRQNAGILADIVQNPPTSKLDALSAFFSFERCPSFQNHASGNTLETKF